MAILALEKYLVVMVMLVLALKKSLNFGKKKFIIYLFLIWEIFVFIFFVFNSIFMQ